MSSSEVIVPVALGPVTSDGVIRVDHIKDLENASYRVDDQAREVMGQQEYTTSNGVPYRPVVLKGEDFTDHERFISNIRKVAEGMRLITPPAELARLLRKSIFDAEIEAMGLWALIVMHEPITDAGGDPVILGMDRDNRGQWVYAYFGGPDLGWSHGDGFVFLAPQA